MTDDIDQLLLNALMEDSRRSLKALAQISGLSSPSVAERLRRLEERGIEVKLNATSAPAATVAASASHGRRFIHPTSRP